MNEDNADGGWGLGSERAWERAREREGEESVAATDTHSLTLSHSQSDSNLDRVDSDSAPLVRVLTAACTRYPPYPERDL